MTRPVIWKSVEVVVAVRMSLRRARRSLRTSTTALIATIKTKVPTAAANPAPIEARRMLSSVALRPTVAYSHERAAHHVTPPKSAERAVAPSKVGCDIPGPFPRLRATPSRRSQYPTRRLVSGNA